MAAGLTRLASDFQFGIQMRELWFYDVSDADRRFFIGVLKGILDDDAFFAWIDDGPEPDVLFQHADGSTTSPEDPRGVLRRGSILGVKKLITDLDSLIHQDDSERNE